MQCSRWCSSLLAAKVKEMWAMSQLAVRFLGLHQFTKAEDSCSVLLERGLLLLASPLWVAGISISENLPNPRNIFLAVSEIY